MNEWNECKEGNCKKCEEWNEEARKRGREEEDVMDEEGSQEEGREEVKGGKGKVHSP